MLRLTVAAALAAAAVAAPAADRVTTLPGLPGGVFPGGSSMYSGYLNITSDAGAKQLHYVFYTSQSGSSSDPVLLWLNGGPGCSSLEGAFQESGPLWTAPGGGGLQLNNYTWNRFSHMLFLEAPACVGFSTASSVLGCIHNDTSTAIDNLAALQQWYAKFPEYQANPFWISGESYAGIYIPTLALNIVKANAGGAPKINLKGILVGNGCVGNAVGVCSGNPGYGDFLSLEQLRGHGLVSDASWDAVLSSCTDWDNQSPACQKALNRANNQVGNMLDVYDIYNGMWGVCNYGSLTTRTTAADRRKGRNAKRPVRAGSLAAKLLESTPANLCTTDADLDTYLNTASVQAALHVTPMQWAECADIIYTGDMMDERVEVYPQLFQAGINVYIYNGDADACVPLTDNAWWTASLNFTATKPWHVWQASDGSQGGYVTVYQSPGSGAFSLTTIRGAGHMVPQTQPVYAYDFAYAAVVKNTPL